MGHDRLNHFCAPTVLVGVGVSSPCLGDSYGKGKLGCQKY
jgi:hypothetical protein